MMESKVVRLLPPANTYLKRLGLSANPFPVAPDASRYFITESLEALAYETLFCIQQRKGFIVITGEVGLGKTTFSRYLINQLHDMDTSVAVVFNSVLQRRQLLEQICCDFGLGAEPSAPPRSLREQVNQLNRFFIKERRQGRNCVIFIDDAQNLSIASLEMIRVLSNLETGTEKLVQVVLLGQQELRQLLDARELRQLRSRVALSREFQPLKPAELERYIDYKLSVTATGAPIQFTPVAIRAIYQFSGGNLRRANMLLDRVLIGTLHDPQRLIRLQAVKDAVADLEEPRIARARKRQRWLIASGVVILAAVAVMMAALYQRGELPALSVAWPAAVSPSEPEVLLVESTPVARTVAVADTLPLQTPLVTTTPLASTDQQTIVAIPAEQRVDAGAIIDAAALREHLSIYGLEDHTERFVSAYLQGDMPALRQQLLAPRGLELFRDTGFASLSGLTRPVLTVSTADGRTERWVLWRPEFRVHSLFYGTSSDEVVELQTRLNAAAYYQGPIDGIVGAMTFTSLFEFQRAHGIPVSGQVDDVTLLWLHEYQVQP